MRFFCRCVVFIYEALFRGNTPKTNRVSRAKPGLRPPQLAIRDSERAWSSERNLFAVLIEFGQLRPSID